MAFPYPRSHSAKVAKIEATQSSRLNLALASALNLQLRPPLTLPVAYGSSQIWGAGVF